jgi:hypothetical protein
MSHHYVFSSQLKRLWQPNMFELGQFYRFVATTVPRRHRRSDDEWEYHHNVIVTQFIVVLFASSHFFIATVFDHNIFTVSSLWTASACCHRVGMTRTITERFGGSLALFLESLSNAASRTAALLFAKPTEPLHEFGPYAIGSPQAILFLLSPTILRMLVSDSLPFRMRELSKLVILGKNIVAMIDSLIKSQ